MKKVNEDELRKVLWQEYGVDGWTLFQEVNEMPSNTILSGLFRRYTNYKMVQGKGLVEMNKKDPDVFYGYKNFDHLYSISGICFDLNQTLKHSKDKTGRRKRMRFKKKREQYLKKNRQQLAELSSEEQQLKWQAPDEKVKKRLYAIRRKKRMLEKHRDQDLEK